jgi:DegV family protein with EDD domain
VHLSSRLSGTCNTAAMAARAVEGAHVHVVDSLTACMAEGDLVLTAAHLAEEGLPAAEIARRVEAMRPRVEVAIMLDSLAHLQRGGRIGRAQSMLGTLLNIKPIVSVEEGIVVPKQRVRTASRALQEMADEVKSRGPLASLRIEHPGSRRRDPRAYDRAGGRDARRERRHRRADHAR